MNGLIGKDIDHYHVIEQLGQGGMATVYKAFDIRLQRDVAIKVIRTSAFGSEFSEQMLKRFEREAIALARMDHPNIIPVHDFGEYEGAPYLVMRFVPGGTLKTLTGKPMPYPRAARILSPIARAIDYAHKQGVIHRDVKPANILISHSGEPMLSDFGVAKILEADGSNTLTGTGVGIGTPEYMAPEQWENAVTAQTDIYALGVVFYELVTGRKPYTADTPVAVLRMQITEALPRPSAFTPDLPDAVEKVIFKALAKNPADRYQTMGEFAVELEKMAVEQWSSAQTVQTGGQGVSQADIATRVSEQGTAATPVTAANPEAVATQVSMQPVQVVPSDIATQVSKQPVQAVPSDIATQVSMQPVQAVPSDVATQVSMQPVQAVPSDIATQVSMQPIQAVPSDIATQVSNSSPTDSHLKATVVALNEPVKPAGKFPWWVAGILGGLVVLALVVLGVLQLMKKPDAGLAVAAATLTPQAAEKTNPPATPIPTQAEPTKDPALALANAPAELTIWYSYQGPFETKLLDLVAQAGKKYPNMTIHAEFVSTDEMIKKYGLSQTSTPDLIFGEASNYLSMARSGKLFDLTDKLNGKLENYAPYAVEGLKVDGRLYAIPGFVKSVVLYYNSSLVPAPPRTMDELMTMVKGGKKIVLSPYAYFMFGFSTAFGGKLVDDSGKCVVDVKGWADAMQYVLDLKKAGAIIEFDYNKAQDLFRTGKAAMIINGPWILPDFKKALGNKLDLAAIPGGVYPAKTMTQYEGISINPKSNNVDAAIELALFLTNNESITTLNENGLDAWVPTRTDLSITDPLKIEFAQLSSSGYSQTPEILNSYFFWFDKAWADVLGGKAAPADAVTQACQAMNKANGR